MRDKKDFTLDKIDKEINLKKKIVNEDIVKVFKKRLLAILVNNEGYIKFEKFDEFRSSDFYEFESVKESFHLEINKAILELIVEEDMVEFTKDKDFKLKVSEKEVKNYLSNN